MWNHRVIEHEDKNGDIALAIHEVYYNDDGTLYAYAMSPADMYWLKNETINGLDGGHWLLDRMREALDKPYLKPSDFPLG